MPGMRQLVPPLSFASRKGQSGRVGVLGGSAEYTGAPYFAAISALKLGADIAHVFCTEEAAQPIKCYSPEIIVHGCLRPGSSKPISQQADEVSKWFPSLTALVVGCGLGRDDTLQTVARLVIERAVARRLPLVIDADGLCVVLEHPSCVRGSNSTVLTPNVNEYSRLVQAHVAGVGVMDSQRAEELQLLQLCQALGGPVIVRKGPNDLLSDGTQLLIVDEQGSPKRSGGQGDVLAGCLGTLLSWGSAPQATESASMLAAWTGCMLTRRFSATAFARHGRAMTASDMVQTIGPVFEGFCASRS